MAEYTSGGAGANGTLRTVAFSFNSASPLVLAALAAGSKIVRAAIVITTPFDGVGATLALGTPATPALLLSTAENKPGIASQYETDIITSIGGATSLQLAISPAGSTQGAGFVLFDII